ncbi:MAG: hypothetical protein J0M16_00010 [Gammaproteobacteria bacterium]|nr:hypothetical protein [Gammaproteobacteria bacterium]
MGIRRLTVPASAGTAVLLALVAGCNTASPPAMSGPAAKAESAPRATSPDLANLPRPGSEIPPEWVGKELPIRMIPNIPESAEAYYAPDNLHVIAQTKDPTAMQPEKGKIGGSLTFTYTDTGEELTRINDKGQDACSWFLPDGSGVIFTSTRDNLDMPPGNWSEETDYPQGAELYTADLKGGNIKRLTNNKYYEAEVTTSLDGKWVFFGRQINGMLDIWKMRIDGTDEQQLTFTKDWQEGAPYPTPDGKHLIFRAWLRSDKLRINEEFKATGKHQQTPMTIFTMDLNGYNVQPRTFTKDMNWAPFIAPDGRHFFYDRVLPGNNWEIVMNDLAGGEPKQITYNKGFDGFVSISWDGKKLLFGRSLGSGFMSNIHTFVMDISSLNVGPENFKGLPPRATRPAGWVEDPKLKDFGDRLGT